MRSLSNVLQLPLSLGAAPATFHSESLDRPHLERLSEVDDRLTADLALRRSRQGEGLLYTGDYQNARQLLAAMRHRLPKPRQPPRSALEAFRADRARRAEEHRLLGNLLVAIDPSGAIRARRAPDVRAALDHALGASREGWLVVPLGELLGMIGSAEWARKGVEVAGLAGRIHPAYGVFAPTRTEPAQLIQAIPDVAGRRVLELGTGTGVLSLLLLARGAASATASDIDPRAVACAAGNAQRLGFSDRFTASVADLFPGDAARADLVVANPPWIPEPARTRLDGAIYDTDGAFLSGFLAGLGAHLTAGGRGYLILSDFAERVGLRPAGSVAAAAAAHGLSLSAVTSIAPTHGRADDPKDLLHAVRSQERVTLFALTSR